MKWNFYTEITEKNFIEIPIEDFIWEWFWWERHTKTETARNKERNKNHSNAIIKLKNSLKSHKKVIYHRTWLSHKLLSWTGGIRFSIKTCWKWECKGNEASKLKRWQNIDYTRFALGAQDKKWATAKMKYPRNQ